MEFHSTTKYIQYRGLSHTHTHTHLVTQCAAVSTALSLIIDAPHTNDSGALGAELRASRATIHGNSPK